MTFYLILLNTLINELKEYIIFNKELINFPDNYKIFSILNIILSYLCLKK